MRPPWALAPRPAESQSASVAVRRALRKSRAGSASAGRLTLKLFGPPRIEREGKPITLDTRKAVAIVAYLALAGRQSRDRLAAMFWPEATTERARGALRRTLSVLRTRALGHALVSDGLSVTVRDTAVEVDVRRFRELIATGRLEEAVESYPGDLLSGFALRDSVEFEEWQATEADELRRELGGAPERPTQEGPHPQRAVAH